MADARSPLANRVDHFASLRGSPEAQRRLSPGLDYERYRITPALVERLRDLTMQPTPAATPRETTMDTLLRFHTQDTFRQGQLDMIRMLESLMATQENQ